jgi:hypothetical protein
MMKKGWIKRQYDNAERSMQEWPTWMRDVAAREPETKHSEETIEINQSKGNRSWPDMPEEKL